MNDLFARTGAAIETLVATSTINGDQRQEILRLAAELREADFNITAMINDRVRAALEAIEGRIVSLEEGKRKADAVVFSTPTAEALGILDVPVDEADRERVRGVFNGVDPQKFDHDGDGAPGGGLPAPPTEDPAQMTAAQARAWLDANGVAYKASSRVAELRDLVAASKAGASGQAAPSES